MSQTNPNKLSDIFYSFETNFEAMSYSRTFPAVGFNFSNTNLTCLGCDDVISSNHAHCVE